MAESASALDGKSERFAVARSILSLQQATDIQRISFSSASPHQLTTHTQDEKQLPDEERSDGQHSAGAPSKDDLPSQERGEKPVYGLARLLAPPSDQPAPLLQQT